MKTYNGKQMLLAKLSPYMSEEELQKSLVKLNMTKEDIDKINAIMHKTQFISFFEGVK